MKLRQQIGLIALLVSGWLQAATIYVDSAAGGANDGSSWANAYTNLETAVTNSVANDEIWVKAGTYTLATASLTVNKNISLYGGFAGTETAISERAKSDRGSNGVVEMWEYTNETIIDGAATYRVVDFTGSTSALIDGFTIQNGAVTGNGAGVLTAAGTTVTSCVIKSNSANVTGDNDGGGGIAVTGAGVLVDGNFIFANYSAKEAGGLIVSAGSGTIQRNLIVNNETPAGRFSGGVFISNDGNQTDLLHNIIANNKGGTSNSSGLRVATTSNTNITNTVIWGNVRASGATNNTEDRGTFNNCGIEGAAYGTSSINLNGTNDNAAGPNFVAPTTFEGRPDGTTNTVADVVSSDWQITAASPLLNAGANAVTGQTLPTEDITGVTYPQNVTNDIGLYEFSASIVPILDDQTVTLNVGTPNILITITGTLVDTFNSPSASANGATIVEDANYATNGQLTYTPPASFAGVDTFTVTADNGAGTSAPATITVNVKGNYFVDAARPDDSGDGLSWATAKQTIAPTLLASAQANEVYVKAGTYNVTTTLEIPTGLTLYGGFAGTESTPSERVKSGAGFPWEFTNETIILGNGFTSGRVVRVAASAEVDGLTISGGGKGGIEFSGNNGIIRNCKVTGNTLVSGDQAGSAGIFTNKVTGFLIDSCLVQNNTVTGTGGGFSADCAGGIGALTFAGGGSSGTISNTAVLDNTATKGPGGIFTGRGSLTTILNCLVAGNTGASGDGSEPAVAAGIMAHASGGGQCSVENSTIVNNTSLGTTTVGGVAYAIVKNSIIWGNNDADSPAQITNLNAATVLNAIQDNEGTPEINLDANNTAATGPNFADPTNGDWQLTTASPVLDQADNAQISATEDILGNDRKASADTNAGAGTADLGAFEYVFQSPDAPIVVSSTNNALDLAWGVVPGVATTAGYTYQIDTANTFDTGNLITGTSDTNSVLQENLDTIEYFIRIRAVNNDGVILTEWSAIANSVVSPVIGLTIELNGDTLIWVAEKEIGVASYQVQQFIDGRWVTIEALAAGALSYESLIDPLYDVRLLVVDNNGFTQTFLPDLNGKARFTYQLSEGWNLLSLPLADAQLDELFAAVDGLPMVWTGQTYQPVDELLPGQAFFVYSSHASEVMISGTATSQPVTLSDGWNMVGVTENQLAPVDADIIYTLQDAYQEVLASDTLLQGIGYWIYRK